MNTSRRFSVMFIQEQEHIIMTIKISRHKALKWLKRRTIEIVKCSEQPVHFSGHKNNSHWIETKKTKSTSITTTLLKIKHGDNEQYSKSKVKR